MFGTLSKLDVFDKIKDVRGAFAVGTIRLLLLLFLALSWPYSSVQTYLSLDVVARHVSAPDDEFINLGPPIVLELLGWVSQICWLLVRTYSRALKIMAYSGLWTHSAMAHSWGICFASRLIDQLLWLFLENDVADAIVLGGLLPLRHASKAVIHRVKTYSQALLTMSVFSVSRRLLLGRYLAYILVKVMLVVILAPMGSLISLPFSLVVLRPRGELFNAVLRVASSSMDRRDRLRSKATNRENKANVYRGAALGRRQIRVLVLHPGRKSEPLVCDLSTIDLVGAGGAATFEALSYVWGYRLLGRSITVNGQSFNITRNLHDALLHLRRPNISRRLWIDALCINQVDLNERATQVSQMGDIYRLASRIIVWLGKGTWATREAFSQTPTKL
ncbi:heterokaryon incompatibility protein [Colletotrichum plurivorum]|uniref:Heterokaryon incompatibility protein n=1 Tax=Colletotrichum plurivorum TaxID=2175906 RepID=A0A8H6JIP8_9PEZI|nr:heterokaryon incompatibility protein [Colletotrichum plurivorum]